MIYATLDRVEPIAADIQSFWFKPEKPLDYIAGQFTELYIPHNADDRGQKRWFTISSSPHQKLFSITTKFPDPAEPASSFKQALRRLPLGTRLQFAEPMGDFVLPKDPSIPLLFIAGGIGVTPIRSMIGSLAHNGEQRNIKLLYHAANPAEFAFTELFHGYPLRQFIQSISNPQSDWHGYTGRVDAQRILQTADDDKTLIYLSGPEVMVERLNDELQKSGVPGHRLVTDFFHGYKAA